MASDRRLQRGRETERLLPQCGELVNLFGHRHHLQRRQDNQSNQQENITEWKKNLKLFITTIVDRNPSVPKKPSNFENLMFVVVVVDVVITLLLLPSISQEPLI